MLGIVKKDIQYKIASMAQFSVLPGCIKERKAYILGNTAGYKGLLNFTINSVKVASINFSSILLLEVNRFAGVLVLV